MKWFRKKLRKGELRDINVDLVSLLFDDMNPANRKGYVYKSTDGKKRVVKGISKKYKSEEKGDTGYLYVTVMEPGVEDSQGDIANTEQIQKACENFAKKGMLNKNDVNHNGTPVKDFFIPENYILKAEDKNHFPETKIGSWVQVIKCENLESELWKKVKKGKFNGVSLAGEAVDLGNNSELIKSMDEVLKKMQKAQEDAKDNKDLADSIAALSQQLESLKADEKAPESEGVAEVVKSLEKAMETLNKAVSVSIKEEGGDVSKIVRKSIAGANITIDPAKKELYKGFAELDTGKALGMFSDNLGRQFIDQTLQDPEDDTLSEITVAPIGASGKIDKGLIEDVILYNTDDERVAQEHSHTDIQFSLEELDADISLKESTAEEYRDALGVDQFGAYMETKVSNGVKNAVKALIFRGDKSGSANFKAINGVVKKATVANDVTNVDGANVLARIDNALRTFSEVILGYIDSFVIYLSPADRLALAQLRDLDRTDQGRLVREGKKLYLDGIPVKSRPIPSGYMIIGLPKFIVVGYINDGKIKVEHSGSDHKYHWYPRLTVDATYIPGGFVKVFKTVANKPPVASGVEIAPEGLNTGDVLLGLYDYRDSYGDAEGTSTFRWLSSATEGGTYSAISGATSDSYTIVAGDATKYIKFEVTPKDANGVAGTAVLSDPVGPCTNE